MTTLGIICVDDEGGVLESLKQQLKRSLPTSHNCLIEVADTGEEALEIIEELREDNIDVALVISDQIMPGMKGDELLVEIHSRYPDILKILLTGQSNAEAVGHAVNRANLYRYITKPWVEMDLALTVTEALRRYRQELQLEAKNHTLQQVNRELADVNTSLANLNTSLEDKVRDRTVALEQANHQLQDAKTAAEAANQSKSAFLASMSHELRTPLNAILGFSQILSKDPTLSNDQQGQLAIINRSGEHLLHLINDVLEMSKIEAGKMTLNLDTVNLTDLLDDLQAMLSLKANAKGLQLRVERSEDLPTYVEADPSKLRQVLINLLGNAVKFTHRGLVRLRVTCQPPQGESQSLAFDVQDTGPGIAAAELDRVFDAFAQTETGRRSHKGTGLGLAISYQLVRVMGGLLKVKSIVGRGSRFWFEVPLRVMATSPAPVETAPVVALAPGQPAYRVLVVDDVADLRLLMTRMLGAVGFQVREAENGEGAIATWQAWHPHLIIMDWQMPVMNGNKATRRIRQMAGPNSPTIIAVSAGVFDQSRRSILAAGCDALLLKPFTETQLFEAIAQHLPVQYRYAHPPSAAPGLTSACANSDEILRILQSSLPSAWLTDLYQSVSVLDSEKCLELLSQIPDAQVEVRQALSEQIHDFRFDMLIELLKPAFS
ncbi:MAG: response regulator [Cyanobacteria bacterium P01_A01_bin.105]